jgi:steroid 5-alpha reductase family enzyme
VSFRGIHFFPAALVAAGSMPLVPTLASESGLAPIDYAALVLGAIAVLVEAVADQQLATFVRSRPPRDAVMQSGLWAWSRHPNYLGEVGFWWALALLGVGAGAPSWTLAGAGAITALFVFISIPMMEKRHAAKRPKYADYQRRVPMLFPWRPPRAAS